MIIHGSDVNIDAVIGIKSLADLEKLNIFSHLPNGSEANGKLWKIIQSFQKIEEPETEKTFEDFPEGN